MPKMSSLDATTDICHFMRESPHLTVQRAALTMPSHTTLTFPLCSKPNMSLEPLQQGFPAALCPAMCCMRSS